MSLIIILVHFFTFSDSVQIFDFEHSSDLTQWAVVDDVVMGGRSNGRFSLSDDGYAVFSGSVSLENNGGFSSVRGRFEAIDVSAFDTFVIRLKGDGKRYQLRVKTHLYDRHSYIAYFKTSGSWETIRVPMSEMYPAFRGMTLDMENFPGKSFEEMGFLIGNKKAESFELLLDSIHVE